MQYINRYASPIGNITMTSDGEALTGLWFDGQKYFALYLDKEPANKKSRLNLKNIENFIQVEN